MRSLGLTALVALLVASPLGALSVASPEASDGRIVFEQTGIVSRDNGEILVVGATGTGQRNLTRNPIAHDHGPLWSPNGRKISFTSQRPSAPDVWSENIYVMNADGSAQRQLTRTLRNEGPVWSPDGHKIAFVRYFLDPPPNPYGNGTWEIYVMNADGSKPRRLTRNALDEGSLSWSQTGRIAFVREPRLEPGQNTGSEVWTMNPDGRGLRRLTRNRVSEQLPVWSPDGRKLAFLRCRRDDQFCSIWLMNGDGSAQRRLTNTFEEARHPVWSPDSAKIAFVGGLYEIYIVDTDTGRSRRVVTGRDSVSSPTWSPDGGKIAFHQYPAIYVMNADGSGKRRLVPKPGRPKFSMGENWGPHWSPVP